MAVDAEAAAASATAAADAAVASSLAGPKLVKRAGGRSTRVNPEVVIHTDQRKGRKQVTIVMGLDLFDIKLADAARACKKAFASGATVAKVCPGRLRGRATGTGCVGGRGGGWRDGPHNGRVGGRGNDVGSGRGKGTVKGRKEVVGKGRRGRVVAKSLHGWLLAVTSDYRVSGLSCVAKWAPPSPACMHRRPLSRAGVLTSKRWCACRPLVGPPPPRLPLLSLSAPYPPSRPTTETRWKSRAPARTSLRTSSAPNTRCRPSSSSSSRPSLRSARFRKDNVEVGWWWGGCAPPSSAVFPPLSCAAELASGGVVVMVGACRAHGG